MSCGNIKDHKDLQSHSLKLYLTVLKHFPKLKGISVEQSRHRPNKTRQIPSMYICLMTAWEGRPDGHVERKIERERETKRGDME